MGDGAKAAPRLEGSRHVTSRMCLSGPRAAPICSSRLRCQGWLAGSRVRGLSVASPAVVDATKRPITQLPSMLAGRSLK